MDVFTVLGSLEPSWGFNGLEISTPCSHPYKVNSGSKSAESQTMGNVTMATSIFNTDYTKISRETSTWESFDLKEI